MFRLNQVKLGAVGFIATQWHGFGYETMFDSYILICNMNKVHVG